MHTCKMSVCGTEIKVFARKSKVTDDFPNYFFYYKSMKLIF